MVNQAQRRQNETEQALQKRLPFYFSILVFTLLTSPQVQLQLG